MPAPPLLWLGLGLLLLTLALLGLDSDGLLLIGGLCALGLTLFTALLPQLPPLLAAALFVGLAGAGYGWLRRWSARQREAALPSSERAARAEVISGFDGSEGDSGSDGRVLWQGQSWAATNLEGRQALPAGTTVRVLGRDGTHLQVLPLR